LLEMGLDCLELGWEAGDFDDLFLQQFGFVSFKWTLRQGNFLTFDCVEILLRLQVGFLRGIADCVVTLVEVL